LVLVLVLVLVLIPDMAVQMVEAEMVLVQ